MNKGKMISNDIDESLNTLKPGPPKQVLSLAAGRVRGRWLIANVGENKIETNKHTRPPLFVGTFPPSRGKLFESYEPLPSGGAADNSVALGPLGARTNLNSAPCTLERKKHYNYQKKKSRTKDDGKKVNIWEINHMSRSSMHQDIVSLIFGFFIGVRSDGTREDS